MSTSKQEPISVNPERRHPVCEIVTIGSELLLGQIADTNTSYLAQELSREGVTISFRTAVGDYLTEINEVIRCAVERCDLVIATGGLGPTLDDLTREAVAQVAGILAAKRVPDLIPLCHPLLLTKIDVQFRIDQEASRIEITATVHSRGKTGVEMEALTAVSVAALTVYDMAKAVEKTMRIGDIRLVRKSGGKSGEIVLERGE